MFFAVMALKPAGAAANEKEPNNTEKIIMDNVVFIRKANNVKKLNAICFLLKKRFESLMMNGSKADQKSAFEMKLPVKRKVYKVDLNTHVEVALFYKANFRHIRKIIHHIKTLADTHKKSKLIFIVITSIVPHCEYS